MGKIAINKTDAGQKVLLDTNEEGVTGGYYDKQGVWHEFGGGGGAGNYYTVKFVNSFHTSPVLSTNGVDPTTNKFKQIGLSHDVETEVLVPTPASTNTWEYAVCQNAVSNVIPNITLSTGQTPTVYTFQSGSSSVQFLIKYKPVDNMTITFTA